MKKLFFFYIFFLFFTSHAVAQKWAYFVGDKSNFAISRVYFGGNPKCLIDTVVALSTDLFDSVADIGIHPTNNKMYAASTNFFLDGLIYITEIDLTTGTNTYVASVANNFITSLECDSKGMVYTIGGGRLSRYDPNTGEVKLLGAIQVNNVIEDSPGDLIFYREKLYMTTSISRLVVEVNVENPLQSKAIFKYPDSIPIFCSLAVIPKGCGRGDIYGFCFAGADGKMPIYKIDIENKQVTRYCYSENSDAVFTFLNSQGASSPFEFDPAPDCPLWLDLDSDNSRHATLWDFRGDTVCIMGSTPIADRDTKIFSTAGRVDSALLRITQPLDGSNEYLTFDSLPPSSISVAGINSHFLRLHNVNNTATLADFETAIKRVRYHSDNIDSTRISSISTLLYANGFESDTAFSFLDLRAITRTVWVFPPCFSIFPVKHDTLVATDTFPIPNQRCIGVSYVKITRLPDKQNAHSDTICAGKILKVGNRSYTQSGVYRDTFPTFVGSICDSVLTTTLTVLPADSSSVEQIFCANASPYPRDTVLCSKFLSSGGCDSFFCKKIKIIPEANSSEVRTLCAGRSVVWGGTNYSKAGIYSDTLVSARGCDSIATLRLVAADTSYFFQEFLFCDGDSVRVGNRFYTQAGFFRDTLRRSDNACDSTVATLLKLGSRQFCDKDDCRIFIPNSFSPNGDGQNDEWELFSPVTKIEELSIFDRWGSLVYHHLGDSPSWSGEDKLGRALTPAVFVYVLRGRCASGKPFFLTGDVTLLR